MLRQPKRAGAEAAPFHPSISVPCTHDACERRSFRISCRIRRRTKERKKTTKRSLKQSVSLKERKRKKKKKEGKREQRQTTEFVFLFFGGRIPFPSIACIHSQSVVCLDPPLSLPPDVYVFDLDRRTRVQLPVKADISVTISGPFNKSLVAHILERKK